ncbi:hypothetical protein EDB92DRAFT_1844190 [Lactarius akahatsu]|uniref:HNH nuclease domain-containing protein n=1 Tax=Lactarius akahatsu TaxID=416441 RepID=A0AAD4LLB2_9AGAM|nr:hypothetical protein EDB92DRAFT_1844190 [Lactarius akahatsu]
MVEIYLNVDGSQFSFLSIPLDDVRRLSISPFKWLRYILHCICGACGDLSALQGGPPVDYDSTKLADDIIYFYEPSRQCIFVDYEGLNDSMTSTDQTPRRDNFRREILARDGLFCVHIIPRSKGDEYILKVDENTPPEIRINGVENGVFLAKSLHAKLGTGEVAFLKTPNYGLDSTDIPRVEPTDREGPVPTDHFTLHRLAMPPRRLRHDVAFTLGSNVDALFQSTNLLPPVVILDYWNSRRPDKTVHSVMGNYRKEHYIKIPAIEPSPPTDNYEGHYISTRTGDEMAKAMDDLNAFLMFVRGITPEEATKRREERMEEEELKAQEASQSKVM